MGRFEYVIDQLNHQIRGQEGNLAIVDSNIKNMQQKIKQHQAEINTLLSEIAIKQTDTIKRKASIKALNEAVETLIKEE